MAGFAAVAIQTAVHRANAARPLQQIAEAAAGEMQLKASRFCSRMAAVSDIAKRYPNRRRDSIREMVYGFGGCCVCIVERPNCHV